MHALFHGTTLSRARKIEAEGWLQRPLDDEVKSVAKQLNVDPLAIWADLRVRHRFVGGETRGQVASFATTMQMGDSWAQRAPEIRNEALYAAWRLLHPELTDDKDAQIDGEVWVLRQQLEDPPAVLTIELTDDELLNCKLGGFYSSNMPDDLQEVLEDWSSQPEIEVPLPIDASRVRAVIERPRRVRGSIALHLLGLAPDEWMRRAQAGEFGVAHQDRYGQWTWAWSDLAVSVVPSQWERRVPVW